MLGRAARWFALLLALFIVSSAGTVLVYWTINPRITPLMLLRSVSAAVDGRITGIHRTWVDLDDVSPALVRAVIAAEDARFFEHRGIDFDAVEAARARNRRHPHRRPHGASTITMQCARSTFLWTDGNWVRKALEAWVTLWMELLWDKRRILEVYLNVVEWGDGVYGAEAAAQRYFGVPAAALTPSQAALMAAALPNPRQRNPARPSGYLRNRASTIARRAGAVSLKPLEDS
jgi:monofunctional biosynthetic peptidoglycan transglycosylase